MDTVFQNFHFIKVWKFTFLNINLKAKFGAFDQNLISLLHISFKW
jgi:hypothetical protein